MNLLSQQKIANYPSDLKFQMLKKPIEAINRSACFRPKLMFIDVGQNIGLAFAKVLESLLKVLER